jgi:hypothetical protein
MAKLKEIRGAPPWGATKKQALQYQRERDRKNREFVENCTHQLVWVDGAVHRCRSCRTPQPMGPANDTPLEVTQELVALYYAEDPVALGELVNWSIFHDGLIGKPAPEDPVARSIWESGALAAHLVAIGGQR